MTAIVTVMPTTPAGDTPLLGEVVGRRVQVEKMDVFSDGSMELVETVIIPASVSQTFYATAVRELRIRPIGD